MNELVRKKDSRSTPKRKRAYELDGMKPLSFPQDPIRQLENEALKDLSDEYRTLKLEQMIEKRRQDVERLREGGGGGGVLPSNSDFLNMAKLMADLSPEEAQRVRSAYSFFKMSERGGSGSMALMPMLLNYARSNPGSSENQMLQYLTLMNSQFAKGLEIARGNPKQDGSVELLKLFSTLMMDNVKKPMEDLAKNMQPQQSAFEQILMNPELFSRAKEIGLFGGGSGAATGEFDLKIEQLRSEREMSGRKMDLEFKKMMLENEAKDRRTNTMMQMLAPISAIFAGPVDERMRQMGRQVGNPNPMGNPTQVQQPPVAPTINQPPKTILEITCASCGHSEVKPIMGAVPERIPCPGCGAELLINPPSGGST